MRKLLILLAALALLAATVAVASAHASLVRADPAPNSIVTTAPRLFTLWFDEDLDTQFSTVSLLDSGQNRMDLGAVSFSADRRQMLIEARPNLPPGAYTVSWRALSAADGHSTRGVYAVFVGAASAGLPAPVNQSATEVSALPLPLDAAVRFINLLAAMALCGALTLGLLAGDDRPAFNALRTDAARRTRNALVAALLVLFAGTIVAQLVQAAGASERSLGEVLAQSIWLQTLTTTRFGQAALARILVVDLLLVLMFAGGATQPRLRWLGNLRALDLLYWLLSVVVLFSISFASHGAASADPLRLSLVMDFLHLVAVSVWMGGLFALALLLAPELKRLPEAETLPVVRVVLARFSNIAIASVVLFALTGLYATWRQVGYVAAFGTLYGITLIVKNVLVAPLLVIGLLNTLILRPDLLALARKLPGLSGVAWFDRAAHAATHSLTVLRFVRVEAMLGALVVLAAATLTVLPPARSSMPPPLPTPFQAMRQSGNVRVSLGVDPYVVGQQTYTARVTDLQDNLLAGVQRVSLRFTFLGTDLGTTTEEMPPAGDGSYQLKGGYLSVVGAWKVETIIRRKDVEDDLRIPYRLNVIDPATNRAEEVPYINSSIAFAVFDLLAGAALFVFSRQRKVMEGQWVGAGAMLLGVALFSMGVVSAPPSAAGILVNPMVPDEASLAIGKTVFEDHCVACHGPQGRGNGPLAATLNPRPADFTLHINQHSDEVTFNWISKGIAGSAMPAWEGALSADERWHVINYLQALVERQQAAPTPAPTKVP
ncbi:MAG: copper resistance protein CopC [Chloroflexi bacterium]|nr:copper resistance protein CopC [Chloroflexota bacterium]